MAMKNLSLSAVVTAGCAFLISAGNILAQDWPQWRGSNRDGKVTGFTAPQKWPAAGTQKWKTTVGTGDATPALVGDKLYVFARQGAEEITWCLNAADGKEIWQNKYEAQAVSGPAGSHPGPRSSPVVANGKVVTLGVGGILSCLDAATGKEVWRKDEFPKVIPRFYTSMSPLIADGICVAHLGGQGHGALIGFDLATGNPKWKWDGEGPAYSSPVLLTVAGAKQIVELSEKSIVGIGLSDGKLLWQVPFAAQGMAYNAATPIVDGPIVICTGQGRGTKAVKIEKEGDGFTAKEIWSNAEAATQFNTPVLKDGLLFGISGRGNLFCLNAKNGQTTWTDSARLDNRGFGVVLDAGSIVLAMPSNSELIAFKPSEKEFSEVGRVKLAETQTFAHPVIAGNRIFVKDQQSVAMLTVE